MKLYIILSLMLIPAVLAQTNGPFVFAYHSHLGEGYFGIYANASYEESTKDITIVVDNIVRRVCKLATFCEYTTKYGSGTHKYYAVAVDTMGNRGTSIISFFSYNQDSTDTSLPFIESYFTPQAPRSDRNLTILAGASDPVGINYMTIIVDNRLNKTCYSSTCNYTDKYPSGSHNYYIMATDNAGNTGTTSLNTFIVDYLPVNYNPRGTELITDLPPGYTAETNQTESSPCLNCQTAEQPKCTNDYDPVCGSNGKTFYNDCYRREAGFEFLYRGDCERLPPKIESVTIQPDQASTEKNMTIEASAQDLETSVGKMTIYVDGIAVKICMYSPCRSMTNKYSYGNHTYSILAEDVSGNRVYEKGNFYVNDGTPPDILSGINPRQPEVNVYTAIVSTARDFETGLELVDIKIDGVLVKTCTSSPCIYMSVFPRGSHFYSITATDEKGNSNSFQEDFTVRDPGIINFLAEFAKLLGFSLFSE